MDLVMERTVSPLGAHSPGQLIVDFVVEDRLFPILTLCFNCCTILESCYFLLILNSLMI